MYFATDFCVPQALKQFSNNFCLWNINGKIVLTVNYHMNYWNSHTNISVRNALKIKQYVLYSLFTSHTQITKILCFYWEDWHDFKKGYIQIISVILSLYTMCELTNLASIWQWQRKCQFDIIKMAGLPPKIGMI